MNRQETLGIMSVIQAAYPNFYKGMNAKNADDIVGLWTEMFRDYPVMEVALAVKAFIASDIKGFPPTIGVITDAIQKNRARETGMLTEQEAWNLVDKATKRATWYSQEEYDKLPPIVQELVGSPQALKEIALMDADEVKTVVASNFQRSYRAKAAQQRELDALPSDVRNHLQALGGGIKKMPELMPWERGM